jgi:NAD(P)-dependent dehydrogenase (short-subunit alcohol dehydrogenase family)/acyl carrier protein
MRSARSEHPERFVLIDSDGSEASLKALPAALASEEAEIALRGGELLCPRLHPLGPEQAEEAEQAPALDPERTVLISGATAGLGALVARHLASSHGARHLLLISRRGEGAPGAKELKEDLQEAGAAVTIAACDVSDRDALTELIAQIDPEHPLGAIVHCAGVLDDGVLDALGPERLERVFSPKLGGAWNLHQAGQGHDLSHFLCFSSIAGLIGGPGQANYAAANAGLDALCASRQAEGLVGTSLAWGGWAQEGEMLAELPEAVRARLLRRGISPLPTEEGLALLDRCLTSEESLLAPVAFDRSALRAQAKAGALPPILSELIPAPTQERGDLSARLASVPEPQRPEAVLDLVRTHVAAVLGHSSAQEVEPERAFSELGFDSLAAVELRNRLGQASGLELASTLVFDYPNALAVAGHLLEAVGDAGPDPGEAAVGDAIARLEASLAALDGDGEARERVSTRLRSLSLSLSTSDSQEEQEAEAQLGSMSAEEMFELIDEELGRK